MPFLSLRPLSFLLCCCIFGVTSAFFVSPSKSLVVPQNVLSTPRNSRRIVTISTDRVLLRMTTTGRNNDNGNINDNYDMSSNIDKNESNVKDITNEHTDRRNFFRRILTTSAAAVVVTTACSNLADENTFMAKADETLAEYDNNMETKPSESNSNSVEAKDKSKDQLFDARYFIAGGGCASMSHGIATPFDVIKTKIQTQPEVYSDGFQKTALTIIEKDGPGGLLTGITPTIVGFGLEGAVKFGVYESLKPVCMALLATDEKTIPYLLASIGAGAVASTMLCPMERARIRMVTEEKKDGVSSSGLFGGIGPMIEEEGFSSILFGYPAMLFKQVPYTITKQCSFDLFASSISLYAMSYLNTWPTEEIRFFSTVSAAFLASILACTMSQPGDVILTKKLKGGSEESVFDLASGIYEEKGFGGFYAGFSARLAHVAAIVTTQLVLYDFLKQLLGLPATVSA